MTKKEKNVKKPSAAAVVEKRSFWERNEASDGILLKETIKKYSKYLNLDEDEIMDNFNDFMFSYTSRIPVEDILEQTREIKILESKNDENKIVSPYTLKRKKNNGLKYAIIYTVSVIVLIVLVILIVKFVTDKKVETSFVYDVTERIG